MISTQPDEDGDTLTNQIQWFRNGSPVPELEGRELVSATETEKGQLWTVEVQMNDGFGLSETSTAQTTIQNTPPQIDTISISPDTEVNTTTLLSCTSTNSDLDGDTLDTTYVWQILCRCVQVHICDHVHTRERMKRQNG